jgi:hypothetical protein
MLTIPSYRQAVKVLKRYTYLSCHEESLTIGISTSSALD